MKGYLHYRSEQENSKRFGDILYEAALPAQSSMGSDRSTSIIEPATIFMRKPVE